MNNKPQNPGFGVVLVSQLAIVFLGGVLLWALDVSLPNPAMGAFAASLWGIVLAVVTFVLFFILYRYGGRVAHILLNDIRRVSGLFAGCSWWHILVVATLAGVGEELLFRVFFQGWLSNYLAITWAIVIASIVFGLLHYLSHAYFICTLLMSIAFGVGYYWSGSWLMVMVWHGVYDLIALGVLIKYPRLIDKTVSP